MKQKDLQTLVDVGAAKQIDCNQSIREHVRIVDVTRGTHGVNGVLLLDRDTGRLYCIIGKSNVLFKYLWQ